MNVVGRDAERAAVGRMLAARSGGLLLAGEPGIGKTVLWEAGVREAREAGWRTLVHRSAQAEAGMAFAGLSDLLGPVFDDVADALATPRRRALEVALLLAEPGPVPPDSRVLGLALLDVLRALATESPVLVALDDVQWLDASSAAVVAMAVRRLEDERIAVLATRRTEPGEQSTAGAREWRLDPLALRPLNLSATHRLLRDALGVELARPTLVAVHEAAGGNPFFALELARATDRDGPVHVPDSLRELLSDRLDQLPPATQDLLLDMAALARPTLALVTGGQPDREAALDAAVVDRIVRVDGTEVRFAHPLLASLTYDRSPPGRRRAVHAGLADLVADPEERARHLALAASETRDATLAAALDDAGAHAAARGATAAAAELAQLAVRHTPLDDHDALVRRRIGAGLLHHQAGDIEGAGAIYDDLLNELPPSPQRAHVLFAAAVTERRPVPRRIAMLEEALGVVGEDDAVAAEVLGYLAINRWLGGDLTTGLRDARRGLAHAEAVGDARLLATAIARIAFLEPFALEETPGLLDRGLALERRFDHPMRVQDSPSFSLGCRLLHTDRPDEARDVMLQYLEGAERRGDEVARAFCLILLIYNAGAAGDLEGAVRHAEAALQLTDQLAAPQLCLLSLYFGAQALVELGRLDEADEGAACAVAIAREIGDVTHGTAVEGVLGRVAFLHGALDTAHAMLDGMPDRVLGSGHVHPYYVPWSELIETHIALGDLRRAEELLDQLDGVAARATRHSRSVAARSRGLLLLAQGDDAGAIAAFERALQEAGDLYPLERGRTLLALGTAHRHARRTRDARTTLEGAVTLFDAAGARLWREKAAAELGRVSGRRPHGDGLTAAELRVAELAAQGKQNKEIAATLFLGVSTVEMHLSRAYRKLGVRSRTELAGRLRDAAPNL
jgi:DNA-binding CsgD family transcriptional regulator